MEKLELYKNMYYYELDMKEKINSRINIPISINTVLVGGLGYFINDVRKLPNRTWVGFYFILLSIFAISVVATTVYVFIAYYGYAYKYITPSMIREFDVELKKYYDDNYEEYFKQDGISKNELVNKSFQEKLIDKYVEASEWNLNLNGRKLMCFRMIGWTTLLSMISGLLTYLLLSVNCII